MRSGAGFGGAGAAKAPTGKKKGAKEQAAKKPSKKAELAERARCSQRSCRARASCASTARCRRRRPTRCGSSWTRRALGGRRRGGRARVGERFANLVLLSNGSDLLLPLAGPLLDALQELLGEGCALGSLLEEVVGRDAAFNEIAA